MYPNFINDRRAAGYNAAADLEAGKSVDELIQTSLQILRIPKISYNVKVNEVVAAGIIGARVIQGS